MSETINVWVIDDDDSIRWVLQKALENAGMNVTSFERADGVIETLQHTEPDAIITDIRMPGMSGLTLLKALSESWPEIPVIIMTAHTDLDSAVSAYEVAIGYRLGLSHQCAISIEAL